MARASCSSSLRPFFSLCSSSITASTRLQTRSIHHRTFPPYSLDHGLEPFLSPTGLRVVAVDYQDGLLSRLNDAVRGTEHEHSSVYKTLLATAGSKKDILIFNYACQALNNAFFFNRLSPKSENPSNRTHPTLLRHVETSFGSLTELKATFSSAAMGMYGSGWIWLVIDRRGHLGVVPTFGPGTVLVQHREERTPLDSLVKSDTPPPPQQQEQPQQPSQDFQRSHTSTSTSPFPTQPMPPSNPFGTRSYSAYLDTILNTTTTNRSHHLFPLLALSIHEHAWLTDYGIWGKEQYVRDFWDVVDWSQLEQSIQTYQFRS